MSETPPEPSVEETVEQPIDSAIENDPLSQVDWAAMTDEQVIATRNDLIAEAENRLAAMTLRNDTVDFANQAKALGRTRPEVEAIIADVLNEVYAEPTPEEPTPEEPTDPVVEEPTP